MSRRTMSTAVRVDATYPIRIKFVVPPNGLGELLSELRRWLLDHVGPGQFEIAPAPMLGGNATGYHFRDLAAAVAFTAAFPQLELADRVDATSPQVKTPTPYSKL